MAKKSLKPKSKYRCTQFELYAICMMGWNNCKKKITNFAALKAMYTLQLIANMITEILAASSIPDSQSRVTIAELVRIQLVKKAEQCLSQWQILKVYITQAFPPEELKIRLEDAGASLFRQASNYNWEILSAMMKKASLFINNNLAQLQANNNMPANFKTQFEQLMAETYLLFAQFQSDIDDATEITAQKINANNSIYTKLILMLKDGQQIFRNNEAMRNEFIFSHLLERVRGISNEYVEFTIPKNNTLVINNIVANSLFTNTGSTELVVCNGEVACTPQSGITVPTGATILIQEDITTITVLNTSTEHKGKCKVRVSNK